VKAIKIDLDDKEALIKRVILNWVWDTKQQGAGVSFICSLEDKGGEFEARVVYLKDRTILRFYFNMKCLLDFVVE
jgi:hypothetical protein